MNERHTEKINENDNNIGAYDTFDYIYVRRESLINSLFGLARMNHQCDIIVLSIDK